MKRLFLFLAAFALSFPALADSDERAESIVRLLNSRASASPRRYAQAVKVVAEGAEQGGVLQQYVMAVLCDASDWPASRKLDEETKARYLAASRPRLEALAEKTDGPLAWYLLYLGTRDEALLEKAVAGGNVQALNTAGTRLLTDALAHPGADSAYVRETAFKHFKEAADKGDANGLNNLGLCLQNGWGCDADEAAAFDCFSRSARQGHAEAINNLGRFHREGRHVKKDLAAALRCFKVSAVQGNVNGQLNYALAILRGEGTEADPERGIEILETMADGGHTEAMDCLSEIYLKGVPGLKPSAMKSTVWMLRARAARGDRHAAAWLKENDESADGR